MSGCQSEDFYSDVILFEADNTFSVPLVVIFSLLRLIRKLEKAAVKAASHVDASEKKFRPRNG